MAECKHHTKSGIPLFIFILRKECSSPSRQLPNTAGAKRPQYWWGSQLQSLTDPRRWPEQSKYPVRTAGCFPSGAELLHQEREAKLQDVDSSYLERGLEKGCQLPIKTSEQNVCKHIFSNKIIKFIMFEKVLITRDIKYVPFQFIFVMVKFFSIL